MWHTNPVRHAICCVPMFHASAPPTSRKGHGRRKLKGREQQAEGLEGSSRGQARRRRTPPPDYVDAEQPDPERVGETLGNPYYEGLLRPLQGRADCPHAWSGGGATLAPGYYLPAFQAEESVSLSVSVIGRPFRLRGRSALPFAWLFSLAVCVVGQACSLRYRSPRGDG